MMTHVNETKISEYTFNIIPSFQLFQFQIRTDYLWAVQTSSNWLEEKHLCPKTKGKEEETPLP